MVNLIKSPSVITWVTMLARAIVVIFVTPFILLSTSFQEGEATNWVLYLTIYNLMMLLDVGFTPTFVRHFAYSLSSKNDFEDLTTDILVKIQSKIYFLISAVALFFVVVTLIWLEKPLTLGSLTFSVSIVLVLYTGKFISCLEGVGKILFVRAVILCQVIFQLLVLTISIYSELNMDGIISMYYFPCVISFFYLKYMAKKCIQSFNTGNYNQIDKYKQKISKEAGKSAVSLIGTVGVIQVMTLYYSQLKNIENSSIILYSMMLIRQISNFSQVPFYTKIPLLSNLYADGELKQLKCISFSYMSLSIFLLLVFGLGVALWNEVFLNDEKWHLPILSTRYWIVLVLSFMLERSLAMVQHYLSINNVIIWHVTGPLFFIFTLIAFYYCVTQGLSEYSVSLPILISSLLVLLYVSVRHRRNMI